jgi:transposase
VPQPNDLSRSLVPLQQDSTLVAVIELSQSRWLVAGTVPGLERQPLKKLNPDEQDLLRLLRRWQNEAAQAGRTIARIAVAFEAGRDGFWLARWLRSRGIEVHVIHATSVAISREHKRAKTDRLDTAMLMRVFLGWLRGERGHCGMVAVPSIEEEDAKRPSRERESLVAERTRIVNRMKGALARLGIRGFKPELRRAPQRLEALRTLDGLPIPPNTLAEFRRDLARLAIVREQIAAIEQARLEPSRLAWSVWSRRRPRDRTRWCAFWPASSGSASRPQICWCKRCCRAACAIDARWRAMPGSRAHPTRAAPSGARRGWPSPATRGFAVA